MSQDDLVDKSKLSQRELLILVADRQESMSKKMDKLSVDYIALHTRVTKLETQLKVQAAFWSVIGSGFFSLIIHFLKR